MTPSRRSLFTGVTAVAALASVPALAANPDAALLSMIAEFDALEHRFRASLDSILDDDEREAANEPIMDRQDELFPLICETRAVTQAGIKARARMIALSYPDLFEREEGSWDTLMVRALVRDLTAAA